METYYINVCIIGSPQTGKRTFERKIQSKNPFQIPDDKVQLQLKIQVSDDYTILEDTHYFCIILLYDITSQQSVDYFKKTIEFIESQNIKSRCLVFVGTKRDITSASQKRAIDYNDLQSLQLRLNAMWQEISLTRGDNVEQFFELFSSKLAGTIQLLSHIEVPVTPLQFDKVDFSSQVAIAGIYKYRQNKHSGYSPTTSTSAKLATNDDFIDKRQQSGGLIDLLNLDHYSQETSDIEDDQKSTNNQQQIKNKNKYDKYIDSNNIEQVMDQYDDQYYEEYNEEDEEYSELENDGYADEELGSSLKSSDPRYYTLSQQQNTIYQVNNGVQPLIKLEQKLQTQQDKLKTSQKKKYKSAEQNRREIHEMIQKRVARNVAVGLKRTAYDKYIVSNQVGAKEIKSVQVNKNGIIVFPKQIIKTSQMRFKINPKQKDELHSDHWTDELRRKRILDINEISKVDELRQLEIKRRNYALQKRFEERNKNFIKKHTHIATLELEIDRKVREIRVYQDSDLKQLASDFVAKYHLQKAFISQIYTQLLQLCKNAGNAQIHVNGCYNNDMKQQKLLMQLELDCGGRMLRTSVFRGDSVDTVVQRLLAECGAEDDGDLQYDDLVNAVSALLPQ